MKTDPTHVTKLNTLLRQAKRRFKFESPDSPTPIAQLVQAFLEWNATSRQADKAMTRLMAPMVDYNDLRVSHQHDLLALIGEDYPLVEERLARLRESLQDVFLREHGMRMETLNDKNKKDIRLYLDTLGGAPQYVAAKVMLMSFGGHAIPVDDKLAALLIEQGAAPSDASVNDIASFLERHIKASDSVTVHLTLKAWSDTKRRKIDPFAPSPVEAPAAAVESVACAGQSKPTRKKSSTTKKKIVRKK